MHMGWIEIARVYIVYLYHSRISRLVRFPLRFLAAVALGFLYNRYVIAVECHCFISIKYLVENASSRCAHFCPSDHYRISSGTNHQLRSLACVVQIVAFRKVKFRQLLEENRKKVGLTD